MKLNEKMKSCFTEHVIMHTVFGLGLGLLLAALFSGLANVWVGIVFMVLAVVADSMRKG